MFDSVRVRAPVLMRVRARARLTIHHKFWGNLAELRQEACRDGGLLAYVTRHGAWARVALLAHGATRWNGRNAARRMLPRQSRRAVDERLLLNGLLLNGLLLNGRLPAANEGVRWGASYARSAAGSAAADALRDVGELLC